MSFSAGLVELNYSIDHPVWTGSGDATWSTAAQNPQNWKLAYYGQPHRLYCGRRGGLRRQRKGTTVNINAADVMPSGVTFNNSTAAYIVQGPHGIAGSGTLFMNGNGSLTILNSNSYKWRHGPQRRRAEHQQRRCPGERSDYLQWRLAEFNGHGKHRPGQPRRILGKYNPGRSTNNGALSFSGPVPSPPRTCNSLSTAR